MNAKELRLGNLVNRLDKIEIINGITKGIEIYYDFITTNKSGVITSNQIEPIQLTEKWLLKAGFKKYFTNGHTWINGHFTVVFDNGMIEAYGDNQIRIKYLHQLQNLYYILRGEELVFSTEP